MLDIEIDGIYCRRCNDLHPTLYWHEKYNDYEMHRKEEWEESAKKRPKFFAGAVYVDDLPLKGLEQRDVQGECIICHTKTYFASLITRHYVCSDECKYADASI